MRPQQNRRVRGRNNNNNGNNNRRGPNPLSRNYESSGPDVKIRGNAQQIADKYISLARDAQGAGDRVMSENYLQHAEHYLRIILAAAGQAAQSLRRDENNEQEGDEINAEGAKAEGERTDTVNCDTDESPTQAQKNANGQHKKAQNGSVREDALDTSDISDEKTDQEQCAAKENVGPVKKTRRSSRRRTVRIQDDASLEKTWDASQTTESSEESLPLLNKEIQKKTRRRRVVTSSAEENV
ncbi:DUF4167 domain-containing protein [Bartonella rattaustraliani]|uniref:DUF4167 domain-containing protein n=1 Tax=Bartonella rattaustraliani TaxID=481139 RepID=UPI0003176C7D|nr:DUF4167 domain-containing protein [Bartonella rattaustraliani]